MESRINQRESQLKPLLETDISIEIKKPEQSLAQDIIETVTGVSSNAITVGGKITVLYSGTPTAGQRMASTAFSSLSMVANVVDFMMTPLGYLYKLYSKKPVPFNTANNMRWALATIALVLAIISAFVLAAARIISFISVGITVGMAVFTFAKFLYNRKVINDSIKRLDEKIDSLCDDITDDMQLINQLQENLALILSQPGCYDEATRPLIIELAETYHRYHENCEVLKNAYHEKIMHERALVQLKSPIEWASTILKVVLAGVILAGAILSLNPVTLPIAMPLLATGAIVSLAALIIKKIILVAKKRHDQKRGLIQDTVVTVKLNSTALIKRNISSHPLNEPLLPVNDNGPTVYRKDSYRGYDSRISLFDAEESIPLLADRDNTAKIHDSFAEDGAYKSKTL